ncbi:MAG: cbb3-type cytochrome oxidase assembly protein CcoS [Bdellovibrionales bacterium]|nr:cbb3-type cytochrome oxidase assembly protein CcoS [Bdellovibrionales bacterium]
MDIVFVLLPFALLFAGVGAGAYIWAVKRGQFDDLETPPLRILSDDEESKS